MPAYVISIREKTTDPDELATYMPAARAARAGHNLTPRALNGDLRVLEGAPVEGVVILEFPTLAEAQAWYDSPAYTAARQHRINGGQYRFMIVEGV
jgi:uncharacterized protein (DUF1330 family)